MWCHTVIHDQNKIFNASFEERCTSIFEDLTFSLFFALIVHYEEAWHWSFSSGPGDQTMWAKRAPFHNEVTVIFPQVLRGVSKKKEVSLLEVREC